MAPLRTPSHSRPLWLAAAIAAGYWLLESALHAYVWHSGAFYDTLLSKHDPNELWMRFIIVTLLLGFGAYMQRTMDKEVRLRARTERLNRLLNFLSHVNQHVQRQHDEQALFDAACRAAVETGGFRFAWIGRTNGGLALAAWAAEPGFHLEEEIERLRQDNGMLQCPGARDVLASGQSRLCVLRQRQDCTAPWREALIAGGCHFAAALPIRLQERTIGVFEVYAGEDGEFSQEELAILDEAADDISVALNGFAQERQLKARLEELERFQKATVDREFRIKELRDEIARLKGEKERRQGTGADE